MTDSDSPDTTETRDMPDDDTDTQDQAEPRDSPQQEPDQHGPPDRDGGRPSMSTMSPPPERDRPGRDQPPEYERGRPPGRGDSQRDDEDTKTKMLRYLYWGGFALLFLFGAFAGWGFYRSIMRVIDIWVSSDFQPIFRALFNLTVVLVSVLGLSMLIRRMDVAFPSAAEE